jgi:hypothetical protein
MVSALEQRGICGCGRGPCVPQREYDRQRADPLNGSELQEMILFSVERKCGYPLGNALKKLYTGLDGRDDKVFIGFKSSISIRLEVRSTCRKGSTITLNIIYPQCQLPYEKWTRQVGTVILLFLSPGH